MSSVTTALQNTKISRLNSQAMTVLKPKITPEQMREFEEQAMPLMPLVLAMAKRETHNDEDAQDLVQETYIKAFRSWGQFQQGTNLKAWLLKIMRNTYLNNAEKKKRDKAKGSIDELEDWQIGGAESLTTMRSRSAEAEAIDNMPAASITEALDRLPAEFKEVVLQAVVMGLPYAEIAQNMGTPVGTVMSRLHRGKKALREELVEYAKEQGYSTDAPKDED